MTTYPNLSLTLPTRGAAGSGHWADVLDVNLANIDAHDHQGAGRGLAIRTAAIAIDADLSFSSLWAITAMQRVTFAAVTPLSENNKSVFVSSEDNELYWRNNTGSNVKLTDGISLNVAGFLGSIGGDYVSVSALEDYDNSSASYRMRQPIGASVRQYARTKTGSIDLLEFRVVGTALAPTTFVRLSSPVALASTYEVTFPAALPANTALAQVDATGVMTFSNTIVGPLTAGGAVITNATISPSALASGNTNNYNPTGLSTASIVRLDATAAVGPVLTGLSGGVDGRTIRLHNVSAVTIQVTTNDGSSTAANQMIMPGTVNIAQNQSFTVCYDGTSSRWRCVARSF